MMEDLSFSQRFSARIIGPAYGFLYRTNQHGFLGFTFGGWLKNLPILLSLAALLLGWPNSIIALGILLAILIRILYWRAKRAGYKRFIVTSIQDEPQEVVGLEDNFKISACASGRFSVRETEQYVLNRPAQVWRVPLGDHTIMVEKSAGRFLYEFIQPRAIEAIESGLLCFRSQPEPALAITYLSTWGPESEEINFQFYAPSKKSESAKLRRVIYLTFDKLADKNAVWSSLLQAAKQPTT
jgi:hypothetical protein